MGYWDQFTSNAKPKTQPKPKPQPAAQGWNRWQQQARPQPRAQGWNHNTPAQRPAARYQDAAAGEFGAAPQAAGKPNLWQNLLGQAAGAARNTNYVDPYLKKYGPPGEYERRVAQTQPPDTRVFGADYGPNWKRADYVPPVTSRTDNAEIMMTTDEYLRRRDALNQAWSPSYRQWYQNAANTPNQPHWLGSDWANQNPMPANFFQSQQEWTLRNNAAPTGYYYTGFGSSYAKKPTLPTPASSQQSSGGGGYGGGWGWGGGGGGGGYQPYEDVGNWFNQMVQWNINRPNPG
jgi:hypothetical protein